MPILQDFYLLSCPYFSTLVSLLQHFNVLTSGLLLTFLSSLQHCLSLLQRLILLRKNNAVLCWYRCVRCSRSPVMWQKHSVQAASCCIDTASCSVAMAHAQQTNKCLMVAVVDEDAVYTYVMDGFGFKTVRMEAFFVVVVFFSLTIMYKRYHSI